MSNSDAHIKQLFDKWNIRDFVLFSLLLQLILILYPPIKKRTGNPLFISVSWLAYLLAAWTANVAVGLISCSETNLRFDDHVSTWSIDILTFWAPFLLLYHSPEHDNNVGIWQMHLVELLNRVGTGIIVFGRTLPSNRLWVPTVFMFVAGTIKYGERTYALFLANLNQYRESMFKAPVSGDAYSMFMQMPEETMPKKLADDHAVVCHAYFFFRMFKGLIGDIFVSSPVLRKSRLFFLQRDPVEAFEVLTVELNFMYEVLYTKAVGVHSKYGYAVRFTCWCAFASALLTFYRIDKTGFRKMDVVVSYTLLNVAAVLDAIALLILAFSDWTAASIQKSSRDNICTAAMKRYFLCLLKYHLSLKRKKLFKDTESTGCFERGRRILFGRGSRFLHRYNMIDYCLQDRLKTKLNTPLSNFCRKLIWVSDILGMKYFYDNIIYVSKEQLTKQLWDFIFSELKKKSDPELYDLDLVTAKKIFSARGEWALQNTNWTIENSNLMRYIVDLDYDQSLILWHIATELCYQNETSQDSDRIQESTTDHEDNTNFREFCKILSEYMLYLLVMQPTMMSVVAGISQIRFRDTCTVAKRFFDKKEADRRQRQEHKQACRILEESTDEELVAVGARETVLLDARVLAKELGKLEWQKRWGVMSEVWVELLSYAASHCKANTHAAQLSEGGELITDVWLLMTHFGIGDLQVYEAPKV